MNAAAAAPRGKLIRRSEAARLLGVSTSTLRRREGDLLNPIVGPDGVHLFDESEVRAVLVTVRQRQAVAALGPSTGETAAEVFTLLDAGEHAVEIVKHLRLPPDVVISLQDQWTRMRNGFVVSAEQVRQLARLTHAGLASSASTAIVQIQQRLERLTQARRGTTQCYACRESMASMCEPCIVRTHGPLGTLSVRIERRLSDHERGEVRVVASVYWNDPVDDGGRIAELRSDWYPDDPAAESAIVELVAGAERQQRVNG